MAQIASLCPRWLLLSGQARPAAPSWTGRGDRDSLIPMGLLFRARPPMLAAVSHELHLELITFQLD